MADPMGDTRLGTREEVVENGDLVTKEHKTVDEMRTDKASATGDEDAFANRRGEKFDGSETCESCVGDGLRLGDIDRV